MNQPFLTPIRCLRTWLLLTFCPCCVRPGRGFWHRKAGAEPPGHLGRMGSKACSWAPLAQFKESQSHHTCCSSWL
jgi:hypothetical protein